MAARKKIGELQEYKERRRRQREIYNLDQKILLDQISEGRSPRNPGPAIAVGHRDRLPLAKDRDVRQLQIEYERAREGGRNPHRRHRQSRRPVAATDTTPRYNPSTDPKVQMLAENHGRQMESLHNKNRDLERQREEIRRRLEDLGRRPPEKDNSNEELLKELRDQEARNQRLLDEMRRQLLEARRPVNIIQPERPPETKKPFIYPVYYGNSLVAEIIAVRQAYLQNGGSDPDILAQLAQMQAEAQAIDDAMKNDQRHSKNKKTVVDFSSLEVENERLQRQLQLLQEQKMISTNRRKDNREGMTPVVRPPGPTYQSQNTQTDTQDDADQTDNQTQPQDQNTKTKPQDKNAKAKPQDKKPKTKAQDKNTKAKPQANNTQANDNEANDTEVPSQTPPTPPYIQTFRAPPPKRPVNKWVQTNPIPSDQIDVSAVPHHEDYPTKRQNAKTKLEGRWGPVKDGPTPRPFATSNTGNQTQPPGKGQKEQPEALESLKPARFQTIEEAAANVEFLDPNEPLDIWREAIPKRGETRRAPYPFKPPFKPNIGPYPNTARAVVVKAEPPYGHADYYGRPLDENGNLIPDWDVLAISKWIQRKQAEGWDEDSIRTLLKLKKSGIFKYRGNLPTSRRMLMYEMLLQDLFHRSDKLILMDPYYSTHYRKRPRYSEDLDSARDRRGHPWRQQTFPMLRVPDAHPYAARSSYQPENNENLVPQQLGYRFPPHAYQSNAAAQTEDPHPTHPAGRNPPPNQGQPRGRNPPPNQSQPTGSNPPPNQGQPTGKNLPPNLGHGQSEWPNTDRPPPPTQKPSPLPPQTSAENNTAQDPKNKGKKK